MDILWISLRMNFKYFEDFTLEYGFKQVYSHTAVILSANNEYRKHKRNMLI